MKNRAQSALEYMMTYGWAILIIVIVAAVLYSLGIFNPSANAGTTSTGFSPFTVLAQVCNTTGLFLQLGNNAGQTTVFAISGTSISTQTGLNATTAAAFIPASATSSGISSGGSVILKFKGSSCLNTGSRYSATIILAYSETTSLGTQNLQATGTVSGPAA